MVSIRRLASLAGYSTRKRLIGPRRLRGGRGEELLPLRLAALNTAHQPGGAVRRLGSEPQAPAHFLRGAIAFRIVAAKTAGDQVLPTVSTTTRPRQNVVDGARRPAAIGATLVVATQHAPPADRQHPGVGDAHIPGQQDD